MLTYIHFKKYAEYKISDQKGKKGKKQTQVNRVRKSKYKNTVKNGFINKV